MTHQVALTIRAKVKPGETEDLKDLLSIVGADIERNEILPFARLSNVHFARFVILDGGRKALTKASSPAWCSLATLMLRWVIISQSG